MLDGARPEDSEVGQCCSAHTVWVSFGMCRLVWIVGIVSFFEDITEYIELPQATSIKALGQLFTF